MKKGGGFYDGGRTQHPETLDFLKKYSALKATKVNLKFHTLSEVQKRRLSDYIEWGYLGSLPFHILASISLPCNLPTDLLC